MTRLNFVYLLVGKRGCGKSTLALKIAQQSTKKIIVISTDDNDCYNGFTKVKFEDLQHSQSNFIFCITENALQTFEVLNNYFVNAIVIFEDCQKYINNDVQKEVKRFIINHRMRNFDVLFMYHSLRFVPPYIAQQYNKIILFKTTDVTGNTIHSKYHNATYIEQKMELVKKNKDTHFFEIINDTNG